MKQERIQSIDIFRGLTILVMVFVNDLGGVTNIPGWMKHVPADQFGMTFVDVVFPAFLFIVGMAIPFATQNRLAKGDSPKQIWRHILIRVFALLVMGVYMVNGEEMNAEASLISHSLWTGAMYIAFILIWNKYPKVEEGPKKRLFPGLKLLGILVLIILFFLFKKGNEGALTGMTPSWWGILGLIGWAYLMTAVIYWACQKNLKPILGIFALLLIMLMTLRLEGQSFGPFLAWIKGQSGHITHSLLCLSGLLCSFILIETTKVQARIQQWILVAVLLAIAAYFTLPYGNVHKIHATPSWALYSAAICTLLYAFIYWLADVKGIKKWAQFLKPAGAQPLLTYILPGIVYAAVGYPLLGEIFNSGFPGVLRAALFSVGIVYLAGFLSRKGIRLQL